MGRQSALDVLGCGERHGRVRVLGRIRYFLFSSVSLKIKIEALVGVFYSSTISVNFRKNNPCCPQAR